MLRSPLAESISPGSRPKGLAIGVLTHPNHGLRRQAIRRTWGAVHAAGVVSGLRVTLRFVVGTSKLQIHLDEQRRFGDLLELSAVAEDWSVLHKTLGWIQVALSWGPEWIACTDDDAYVRLELVTSDLQRVASLGYERVAYGPAEWFAFDRRTGILGPWGKNVKHATRAWHEAAHARYHPAVSNRTRGTDLTPPFPFLKVMVAARPSPRRIETGSRPRSAPPSSVPSNPLRSKPPCPTSYRVP